MTWHKQFSIQMSANAEKNDCIGTSSFCVAEIMMKVLDGERG